MINQAYPTFLRRSLSAFTIVAMWVTLATAFAYSAPIIQDQDSDINILRAYHENEGQQTYVSDDQSIEIAVSASSALEGLQVIQHLDSSSKRAKAADDHLQVFSLHAHNLALGEELAEPLLLSYYYTSEEVSEKIDESLHFVYFNGETGAMEPLETEVDLDNQRITALVTKLGTFGIDGDDAGWSGPPIEAFDVALAKGSGTYQYNIPLPVGPNGFSPKLQLHYNSGIANGLASDTATDTEWMGIGWSMDLGRISGDRITLNGISSELIEGANNTFYTKQNAFLKIERFDRNLTNPSPNCMAIDGAHWWRVTDQEGTEYYFGTDDNNNGSTVAYMKYADGKWRWRHRVYKLYKVVDVNGNTMNIIYDNNHFAPAHCGVQPISQSYPQRIEYTTNAGAGDTHAEHVVEFELAHKGYTLHDQNTGPRYGDSDYKLANIKSYYKPLGGSQSLIRQINFSYDTNVSARSNKLMGIEITDEAGGTGGTNVLPKMSFTYVDRTIGRQWDFRTCLEVDPCRYCNTANNYAPYTRPFLDTITNGYGGTIDYNYAGVSRNNQVIYQAVSERHELDAITGTDAASTYVYSGANFQPSTFGSNSSCNWVSVTFDYGNFYGYSSASITDPLGNQSVYSYDNSYDATAEEEGIFNGRELEMMLYGPGSSNPHKVTKNFYTQTGHSSWPTDVRFVYLNATENYTCEGLTSNLGSCVKQRTEFTYNVEYGQLISKVELDHTNAIYRTTNTGYKKHPTRWLFRRTYESLFAGTTSGELQSTTWYSYDNRPLFDAVMSTADKGVLSAVRRYQNTNSGIRFVDTRFYYDAYGNTTNETKFNSFGLSTSYATGSPQTTLTEFDADHGMLPVQVTNALGHVTTTSYDFKFQVPTEMTDANGHVTVMGYDSFGRPLSETLPDEQAGQVTSTITYPANGTVFSSSNPYKQYQAKHLGAGVQAYTYKFFNGFGKPIQTHTTGDSGNYWHTVHTQYDLLGQPVKVSVPTTHNNTGIANFVVPNWTSLAATSTSYDPVGRVKTVSQPNGETTQHTYLFDTTGPGYTATNTLRHLIVDELGHADHQVTDVFGNLIRVRDFTGTAPGNYALYSETIHNYDVGGNLVETVDDLGNTTTYTYDLLGRKVSMTDPDMGTWTYTYDPLGNPTVQEDARGAKTNMTYDALNRITTKTFVSPSGVVASDPVTYTYDGNTNGISRLSKMWDADGSSVDFSYDSRGQLIKKLRVMGGRFSDLDRSGGYDLRFMYDNAGRLVQTKYPNGDLVKTAYTKRGLPNRLDAWTSTWRDDFGGTTLPTGWTKGGNVTMTGAHLKAVGDGVGYNSYAERSQRLDDRDAVYFTFRLDGSSPVANYLLDTGSYGQSDYRRWAISISGGKIKLTTMEGTSSTSTDLLTLKSTVWYDAVMVVGGTDNFEVKVWERSNPMISKEIKQQKSGWNGKTWRFLHQLKTGTSYLSDYHELLTNPTQNNLVSGATYNNAGDLTSWTAGAMGGNLTTSYTYYSAAAENQRVQRIQVGSLLDLNYSYDEVGNLAELNDLGRGQVQTFSYDHLNRLVASSADSGAQGSYSFNYQYNVLGNLMGRSGRTYTYSTTKPHAVTQVSGVASYLYDANGNRTRRTKTSNNAVVNYNYTTENKLANAVDVTTNSTRHFYYDGNNNRLVRENNGIATLYIDDLFEKTGTEVVTYYSFGGKKIAVRRSTGLYFLHSDHLGTMSLTTLNGAVQNQNRAYPFGQKRWNSGTSMTDFDYTGQRLDDQFNILDYGARFYDGDIGRFLSPDTIIPNQADSQSFNRYSYVNNNPLSYNDPDGHSARPALGLFSAILNVGAAGTSLAAAGENATVVDVVKLALTTASSVADYKATAAVTEHAETVAQFAGRSSKMSKIKIPRLLKEANKATAVAENLGNYAMGLDGILAIAATGNTLYNYGQGNQTRMETQAQLFQAGTGVGMSLASTNWVTGPAVAVVGFEESGMAALKAWGYVDPNRPSAVETAGMIYAIGTEAFSGNSGLVWDVIQNEISNLAK